MILSLEEEASYCRITYPIPTTDCLFNSCLPNDGFHSSISLDWSVVHHDLARDETHDNSDNSDNYQIGFTKWQLPIMLQYFGLSNLLYAVCRSTVNKVPYRDQQY